MVDWGSFWRIASHIFVYWCLISMLVWFISASKRGCFGGVTQVDSRYSTAQYNTILHIAKNDNSTPEYQQPSRWLSNTQPWWRHQMETFSALLAICAGNSPVSGEFLAQRPVTRSFDIFFDLRLNKWLSKQSWGWWFQTLSCPLWRHSNWWCRYPWVNWVYINVDSGNRLSPVWR